MLKRPFFVVEGCSHSRTSGFTAVAGGVFVAIAGVFGRGLRSILSVIGHVRCVLSWEDGNGHFDCDSQIATMMSWNWGDCWKLASL